MAALSRCRVSWSLFAGILLLAGVPGSRGQEGGVGGPGGGETSDSGDSSGAECDQDGSSADYFESFRGDGSLMERLVGSSTNCPNHVNWPLNPNTAREIGWNESIPAYPMMFASGGTTDLSNAAMYTGIMLNGVSLFSSWARDQVETYEDTAFAIESSSFDPCGGHATTEGYYHYHSTPGCLQEQAMMEAGTTSAEHSPQLGWATDGFPVYGQLGPDGVEMLMCGVTGAHETYCLDICSGYEGELPGVDGFLYRYYLSCGADEIYFPFTTNCFRGCCPDGLTCARHVEDCGTSPEEGYSSSYVPETATDLSAPYDADFLDGDDSDYIDTTTPLDCALYLGSYGSSTSGDPTTDSAATPSPTTAGTTPAPAVSLAPVTPAPTAMLTPVPEDTPTETAAPMSTDAPTAIVASPTPAAGTIATTPSPSTQAPSVEPSSAITDQPGSYGSSTSGDSTADSTAAPSPTTAGSTLAPGAPMSTDAPTVTMHPTVTIAPTAVVASPTPSAGATATTPSPSMLAGSVEPSSAPTEQPGNYSSSTGGDSPVDSTATPSPIAGSTLPPAVSSDPVTPSPSTPELGMEPGNAPTDQPGSGTSEVSTSSATSLLPSGLLPLLASATVASSLAISRAF